MPAFAPEPATVRLPYWLTSDERADLTRAVETFLGSVSVLPDLASPLAEVLLELEVTSARDRLWPAQPSAARQALGYTPDTVAVRLSPTERDALLTVPGLPDAVRIVLT